MNRVRTGFGISATLSVLAAACLAAPPEPAVPFAPPPPSPVTGSHGSIVSVHAVERANGPLAVDDPVLTPTQASSGGARISSVTGGQIATNPPGYGMSPRIVSVASADGMPVNVFQPPVDVVASPVPNPGDGLQGNRQVAITPFPNLDIQAGPLAQHQLPWYRQLPEEEPYTILRAMEFDSLFGALKSNGVDNSQGGWYNGLQFGFPFWTERQVGMQIGAAFEPNMLQTNYVRFTGGFYRHAIWPESADIIPGLFQRIGAGTVYDGLYDSEHRSYVGQVRNQIGYALSPSREAGVWFTVPMQSDFTLVGPNAPINIATSTTASVYYRQTFPSEVDATIFLGWAEGPGGMNVGTYLAYHFAQQASLVVWGMFNFESAGANAIYAGLRFHFAPHEDYTLLAGNPQNRYRPLMRLADPIQLQLRKTLP